MLVLDVICGLTIVVACVVAVNVVVVAGCFVFLCLVVIVVVSLFCFCRCCGCCCFCFEWFSWLSLILLMFDVVVGGCWLLVVGCCS